MKLSLASIPDAANSLLPLYSLMSWASQTGIALFRRQRSFRITNEYWKTTSYEYLPLDGQRPQTRILTIFPAATSDPIYRTLNVMDFKNCANGQHNQTVYVALSYVCGGGNQGEDIWISSTCSNYPRTWSLLYTT